MPEAEKTARAKRAVALRIACGLTQDEAVAASRGEWPNRTYLSKLETGIHAGSSARTQRAMANAYRIELAHVEPYLRGDLSIADVLRGWPQSPTAEVNAHYDSVREPARRIVEANREQTSGDRVSNVTPIETAERRPTNRDEKRRR